MAAASASTAASPLLLRFTHTAPLLPLLLFFLVILPLTPSSTNAAAASHRSQQPPPLPTFREAPAFRNADWCPPSTSPSSLVHIAMTLDATYLRGTAAAVLSVLRHASCPDNIRFHFLSSSPPHLRSALRTTLRSTFPSLPFHLHRFDPSLVRSRISPSVRPALDQPLNYARIYLPDLLPARIHRAIYLDSDVVVVDDVARLFAIDLRGRALAAPEYCHANFTAYFTDRFWRDPELPTLAFANRTRRPCYFNTGVMVLDLDKWRSGGYTRRLEWWMSVQQRGAAAEASVHSGGRIYELGSLPPFLLVFAGEVEGVEHRWNQHGLGGDNAEGRCRELHPGKVSLLHWSGKGKPWLRLDAGKGCPVDELWRPYDLVRRDGEEDVEEELLFFQV